MVSVDAGKRDPAADVVRLREAVRGVVEQQAKAGLNVVDDGEFSKSSFVSYVSSRLGGLAPTGRVRSGHWAASRDSLQFPEYYARQVAGAVGQPIYECTGPLIYQGMTSLQTDLGNLKDALASNPDLEAFVPSIAPANIENWNANRFYKTDEEYRTAIADAMRVEYQAIVNAGFLLQVDDP